VTATATAGFACAADGSRWVATGDLTFDNAGPVLARTRALPWPASGVVDVSGLGAVDSTAVALLLAIKRRAATQGREVTFTGVTASLASLAALYGIEDMLGAHRA
jgi:ABC-type transporter Mla MlaB component